MNDTILPPTAFDRHPTWLNFFENRALVQFNHRTMAYLTSAFSLPLLYIILKSRVHCPASYAGLIAFMLVNYQAVSGIITLLNLVPKEKASMHQATAFVTLSAVMLLVYLTKSPKLAKTVM
jgi:cytochrome c oxidase assembly protein subunit 15